MSTVRLLDQDNPREGHSRMPVNRKMKIHGDIRDEGTVFNISITARKTEDGPKCRVEMECGQHPIIRTAIRTGPTSTKRDAVLLAIHLAMRQYAGNEQTCS